MKLHAIIITSIISTSSILGAMAPATEILPDSGHFKNLQELNKDFHKNAPINGLVSYLYYPFYGQSGTVELEVEGLCRSFKSSDSARGLRPLSRKMKRSLNGAGLPFYRYCLSVTPEQLAKLSSTIKNKPSCACICSWETLDILEKDANLWVPLPFKLSPSVSANYLSAIKTVGLSSRIKSVDYYGKNTIGEHMQTYIPFILIYTAFGAYIALIVKITLDAQNKATGNQLPV